MSSGSASAVQQFWRITVVEGLLSEERMTLGRKSLAYKMFDHALPLLPAEQVPILFPRVFLQSLMTSLNSEETYLHPLANLVRERIVSVAFFSDDSIKLALITQLIGPDGSARFDAVTKSKTVATLLAGLSIAGVTNFVASLQTAFLETSSDPDAEETSVGHAKRESLVNQMVSMVKNTKVPRDELWPMSVAKFLFVHAFCKSVADPGGDESGLLTMPELPVCAATAKLCKDRFFTVVTELSTALPVAAAEVAAGAQRVHGLEGTNADGEFRLYELGQFAFELFSSGACLFRCLFVSFF